MSPFKRPHQLLEEEDGQALLYGAGVVLLIVALFYGAIDVGQLVLGKIQAQNAADAAAMSAASIKASVHNTRSLAYRATTGQVKLTRLQLFNATSIALQEIGGPNASHQTKFNKAIKLAKGHRKKVEQLRKGLQSFNDQVTRADFGPRHTRIAAEIGYKGNLGTLGTMDSSNLRLMNSDTALAEAKGGMVGGVPFTGEALNSGGHAGKSLVVVSPKVSAFGSGIIGYAAKSTITAAAVAGPVPAKDLYGAMKEVDRYGIQWITVRLMPLGKGDLPQ